MTDDSDRMLQVPMRGAGRHFALADFAAQFPHARLILDENVLARPTIAVGPVLEPADLSFQVRDLFSSVLDFASERLPLRRIPRDRTYGERELYDAARQLAEPFAAEFLVCECNAIKFLDNLLMLLGEHGNFSELLSDFTLPLQIGRSALLDVAQIHQIVQFLFAALQALGDIGREALHQRR